MSVLATANFEKRFRFRESSRARLCAVGAIGAFLVAVALALRLWLAAQPSSVTVSNGHQEGLPSLKWMSLDGDVPGGNLHAKAVVTEGSLDMLERVDRGELDFAFVQGGFDMQRFPNVQQVVGLNVVPLVLLVKQEIHSDVVADLGALRGKSVNLGSGKRTGTYWLSRELLAFAGIDSTDYRAANLVPAQLLGESDRTKLPDAVFLVTDPPSRLVHHLAVDHRYRLVPLPFGEAFRKSALASSGGTPREGMSVRIEHIPDAVIPAFSYGVSPAIPPQNITTVGSRALLVTHRSVRPATVIRVLETLFESRWANAMEPPINKSMLRLLPEAPLHAGAIAFRDRDQPMISGDLVSFVSNALQILTPVFGGLLFLRGWLKSRSSANRERSFDHFLALVSAVDRNASALNHEGALDEAALHGLQHELSVIKESAIRYIEGHEISAEAFAAILLGHIADVRASMIELHRQSGTSRESRDGTAEHVLGGAERLAP